MPQFEAGGDRQENGDLDDPVHSVTVYTIWPRFKSGTFVDNDSYSDLVASQAPEWYIRATFKGDMDLPLSSATNRLVYENTSCKNVLHRYKR